jgi:hypothetical protein
VLPEYDRLAKELEDRAPGPSLPARDHLPVLAGVFPPVRVSPGVRAGFGRVLETVRLVVVGNGVVAFSSVPVWSLASRRARPQRCSASAWSQGSMWRRKSSAAPENRSAASSTRSSLAATAASARATRPARPRHSSPSSRMARQ